MRKKEIKCPYCGSKAKLVHFYDIYGKDATHPERYAWACARFPQCDSYVSTIKGSTKPAGTLADAQLRHERIEAHRVIKKVVESGMDQHSVYRYRKTGWVCRETSFTCKLRDLLLPTGTTDSEIFVRKRCGTC